MPLEGVSDLDRYPFEFFYFTGCGPARARRRSRNETQATPSEGQATHTIATPPAQRVHAPEFPLRSGVPPTGWGKCNRLLSV